MERKNLLYEILLFHEWLLQESEVSRSYNTNYNALISTLTKPGSAVSQSLIKSIREDHVGWQFAVGMRGKIVAVLTDFALEIRSAKDNYATAVASIPIEQDFDSTLRRIGWSPDGTLLAFCDSQGAVEVYDLIGTKVYEVFSAKQSCKGPKVACLFSTIKTKGLNWQAEMTLIDFIGNLEGFFISHDGFQESCSFSFAKYYPGGLTAAAQHPSQPGLFVAGLRSKVPNSQAAASFGITSWRIIDTEPYFEPMQEFEDTNSLLSRISSRFIRPKTTYDVVLNMCPSPGGKRMGVIHLSGAISIWSLPSCLLEKYWVLEEQPGFDELSPALLNLPARKRAKSPLMKNPRKFHPVDLNWWSEDHLIVARVSGAVSVVELSTFRNILGSSPEFLHESPRLSQTYKNGFLAVECEAKNVIRKRTVSGDESEYETYSDESDEEESVAIRAKKAVRSVLFWATDSEKFQPPLKKPKILLRTYQLLGVKSTTPQELYARKLDQEEYGEALLLARTYGLDTDLVFQRQWRNNSVTLVTIKDYLSKVKNRSWVLNECLTKSANDPDAAKELFQYGLRICDIDTFVVLGEDPDSQTAIVPAAWHDDYEDPNLSHDSVLRLRQQREELRRRQLLEKIDPARLNDQQKLLLNTRKSLLQYNDRLYIYEAVLGGPHKASDYFDPKFFAEFCKKSTLQAALDFAHAGKHEAFALILTYHSEDTLPYRLALVAAFPETLEPFAYRHVLPECDSQGEPFRWDTARIRLEDWCETDPFSGVATTKAKTEHCVDPAYEKFYNQDCDPALITAWYIQRAKEIESRTKLVGNAADLVRLGVERNVQGLEEIYDQLATLETLVYECQLAEGTSLKQLQASTQLEIAKLIMSKTTSTDFVNDLHYSLLRYLDRCERGNPGQAYNLLREYLLSCSEDTLSLAHLLFEYESKNEESKESLIKDPKDLVRLAVDCVYACQSADELDMAFKIYECLPERGSDDDTEMVELQDRADELERVLNSIDLLKKYDVKASFQELKSKSENFEESKKLLAMLSRRLVKSQSHDESEWRVLLRRMLELREQCLTLVSPQLCCEFVVESLLSSGDDKLMHLAASLIDGTKVATEQFPSSLAVRVPIDRGQKIALKVAREYLDSASGVDDAALQQSRTCLAMFTVPSEDMTSELNLISSIQMLGEMGVEILPLQVRLKEDRVSLVEAAIKARPKNYRNPVKLIRLGQMLCSGESKKREIEGLVLTLVAEKAVEAGDLLTATQTCRQIADEGFEAGWKVCWKLAASSSLDDVRMKEGLYNFALVHCDETSIGELLIEKTKIVREKLAGNLRTQIESSTVLNLTPEFQEILEREGILGVLPNGKAVGEDCSESRIKEAKKHFVDVANLSTRHVMNTVLKTDKFIKDVTGYGKTDSSSNQHVKGDKPVFLAPAFYEDFGADFAPSSTDISYTDFSPLRVTDEYYKFFTNLARYILLDSQDIDTPVSEGLVEGAYGRNHLEFHALLMCESDVEGVWRVFQRLKTTETCLMYAAYQISIRLLAGMGYVELMETIHRRSFKEVVQRALKLPKSKLKTEVLKRGYDLLHECWNLLGDTIQARQLKRLDPNVDAARFATDEEYKKDTIVGLACTTDEALFTPAVQLAERFGVEVWEVHYSFFFALMTDSEMESSQLEAKLAEKNVLEELKKNQETLEKRMEESVYSTLSGLDHARLILFWNVLLSSQDPKTKEKADNAIKILKRLKQYRGMNFKKLTSGKEGFIGEVYSVLGSDNVNNIIKLAASVSSLGGPISPSSVYAAVSEKVVLEGHSRPGKPANSHGEWLSRYDDCKDFFAKLDHRDFVKVLDKICFSQKAVELIPTQTRCDFLNRSLKFVRQQTGKLIKEFRTEEEAMWNETKTTIELWLVHLTTFASDIAEHLKEDEGLVQCIRDLESTKGDLDGAIRVQKEIAHSHPRPFEALQSISVLLPPDAVQSPEELLLHALKDILSKLKTSKPRSVSSSKLVSQLKSRVVEARRACEDETLMVMEEDVRDPLEDFCRDSKVELSTRIAVSMICPKEWQESPTFKVLLLTGTSLDLIQTHWPQMDIGDLSESSFGSDEKRYELFSSLLAQSGSVVQFKELLGLLKEWPEFENGKYRELESHPIVVIAAELSHGRVADMEPVVIDIITKLLDEDHPAELVERVFDHIRSANRRLALKLALYTTRTDLIERILEHYVLMEIDFDGNILDLIRRKELQSMFEGTVIETALKKTETLTDNKDSAFLSKWVPSSLGNIATGLWGGRGKK